MSNEQINIDLKVVAVDKDYIHKDRRRRDYYDVRFKLSDKPPDNIWVRFFDSAYQDNPYEWKGEAYVEADGIIVTVRETTDMQALLNTIIKKSVERANREYNKFLEGSRKKEERIDADRKQRESELQKFKKKLDNLKF